MSTALMVVDVQRGFDRADFWGPRNNPECEANIAALLERWRGPKIFVRHDSEDAGSPLVPGQTGNDFKDVITGEPDLHAWLQERGITRSTAAA